jgi:GTPase Era involved in 16S rRNA processing
MSKFFNSELIREELKEINELQKFLYGSILTFGSMTRENKIEHIEKLSQLLEKQQIMYTRLSLSDDPQAIEMKENLRKSVSLMGFSPDTDMNLLFNSMNKTIESLKQFIDK